MNRWFRFYSSAIRDPKVVVLSDSDYRLWTELLCVASDNEGLIPPLEALKSLLKRRSDHLHAGVNRLTKAGLVDIVLGGFQPHNWLKFQYKSDFSAARVAEFRRKQCNGSVTPPETETEAEAESNRPQGSIDVSLVNYTRGPLSIVGGGK